MKRLIRPLTEITLFSMLILLCLTFSCQQQVEEGLTEEEILEAASVAIYMGGGPAFSNIKHVINALEALSDMKESKNAEK